ncbi:MAG TPA: type II secretion system major pseudopilin GspG [Candidatus Competibacteraceae bacterium]|nr:type II secretion system major pseudopilin GspG [Candidatus Competibacteraceae bacterium]
MRRRALRQTGFSLIELLVVLVILGLLAGIVAPQFIGEGDKARPKVAKQQIESLGTALDTYKLDVGRYPNTAEGLRALVEKPAGSNRWNGPYLRKSGIPKDPWDNDYQYRSPGENGRPYDLLSFGADGAPGGEGLNADIVSWQ